MFRVFIPVWGIYTRNPLFRARVKNFFTSKGLRVQQSVTHSGPDDHNDDGDDDNGERYLYVNFVLCGQHETSQFSNPQALVLVKKLPVISDSVPRPHFTTSPYIFTNDIVVHEPPSVTDSVRLPLQPFNTHIKTTQQRTNHYTAIR